jgi:competence protein ComEA
MQFVGLPTERAETAVDEALRPASQRLRSNTDDENLASGGGGRRSALAARPATNPLVARLRRSVWAPVALRAAAIAAGLLGLAAVGAASTLNGAGIEVAVTSPVSAASPAPRNGTAEAAMGAAWLSAGPEQKPKSKAAPSEPSSESKASTTAEPAPEPKSPGVTEDGRVILNTANAEELTKLPSVGKKRAEAIIELRKRLKRFRRPTDLLRVRGIGVKTLKKMLPHLVVDPPTNNTSPTTGAPRSGGDSAR